MSDLVWMYGMKMSQSGICRKCGVDRGKGNHKKCDRWPSMISSKAGFQYNANSVETTIAELKKIVELIVAGEPEDTPVQFEIRIRGIGD
jgi:hypothetical protein